MGSERDDIQHEVNDELDDNVTDLHDEFEAEVDDLEPDDATSNVEDASPEATDEATESLRELVTYIVHNMVDHPDDAEIAADRRGSSVFIQVRLPEEDLGKVIGRGGRIAKAIRTVLMVAGSRHHLRVSLDIES